MTGAYRRHILLLMKLLLMGATLWARDVTIFVEDSDLSMPLEGAVIHSWDGVQYVCDYEGKALVQAPDDRQVSVQVTYPGYATGRLAIPVSGDRFTLGLDLGGAIASGELVIVTARPTSSETRSGRSVAISGEVMERSSMIGVIEDVMTSIKLLPGVGYTGMFNAQPSIRGGLPGDLMATLDGFYIENPYHWGGGFSIFDPHMVSSAQLSHGVFSARNGHTVSGLLEVSSKRASPDHAELELGVSSSAVNLSAAVPIGSEGVHGGGLMIMGKITYWDPFVWLMKKLSGVWDNEALQMVNAVTTAPYIRSGAASFNYRINTDLEITSNAFFGLDGVGADYLNDNPDSPDSTSLVQSRMDMAFKWDNLQTFFISGLTYNPAPSMVFKASVGAGYEQSKIDAKIDYDYLRVYKIENGERTLSYELDGRYLDSYFQGTQSSVNLQGRFDLDWSLGNGFIFAAGIQELYNRSLDEMDGKFFVEQRITGPYPLPPLPPTIPAGESAIIHYPIFGERPETKNERFNTSAYFLYEYTDPGNRFGTELGLRVDHLYFRGSDFGIQTMPALNPRLNFDYNIFRNRGPVESLDFTAGTGFFSSVNDAITDINIDDGIGDFELKPNRSWTTVLGVKSDFLGGWSLNVEGYFKYIYDRAYQFQLREPGSEESSRVFRFNGDGIIWGFDLMLQKLESRYWDGWLSYTFNHARYHIPEWPVSGRPWEVEDYGWYYPGFHRFHNLNLVSNFKPLKNLNIYTRLGLATGVLKAVVGEITAYEVQVWDENGPVMVLDEHGQLKVQTITKYRRDSWYTDDSRTTPSIPLDVKFSYITYSPRSKVQTETYFAAENLLSLFYVAKANTSFNSYTGQENTGSDSASYELPIPMVSVGVRWSF